MKEGERYGIDVSAHQDVIDWRQVTGDGITFAYIKATELRRHDAERVGCWHLIGNHELQMYGRLPIRVADVARCANVPSCGAGSLGVWIRMLTAVSA